MKAAKESIKISCGFKIFFFVLLVLGPREAAASFRVPWQSFETPLDCQSTAALGGYFRPEYVELVQRLDAETMEWLIRTYNVLGWRGMDPRIYTPKAIPGSKGRVGFQYDKIRRSLQLEALFEFGPVNGNGTLIEELLELDQNRLLTVNRGSRNFSVINLAEPDVDAVIPAPRGPEALEINRKASELYVIEHNSQGMLVFSLKNYSFSNTLFLDFDPGAVLLSSDTRYLFFTDNAGRSLVRLDLASDEEPQRVRTDIEPPYLLALETGSAAVFLASRSNGALRVYDPASLSVTGSNNSIAGAILAYHAPPRGNLLYVASGDCRSSAIYRVRLADEVGLRVDRLVSMGGAVSKLASDPEGNTVFAISGRDVYRVDPQKPGQMKHVKLGPGLRNIVAHEGKLFISGGLRDLYMLNDELEGRPVKVRLEMGPGPLIARDDRLYVANGLASSITILDTGNLEEEVSILVGVLLGSMVYQDRRIVVNNCFRGSIMVLDPDTYRIEDIVPVGGGMFYNPESRSYVFFDDSLVVSMQSPPSNVSTQTILDLPRGVQLFAPTPNPEIYLVADQDRNIIHIDLSRYIRRGIIPLPSAINGLITHNEEVFALAPSELYRFSVKEMVGLSRTYSTRPFKVAPPYVASDGFTRTRGSVLEFLTRDRLVDVYTTRGPVRVIRQDPDTTYTWIGTTNGVHVFERKKATERSTIPVSDGVDDIYLPGGSIHGYITNSGMVSIVDRETLFRRDEIRVGGEFVYVWGDDLYLRDKDERHKLVVADGLRGMTFQELYLPLVPTDAASDGERLFLLGAAQGALAIYVNRIDTARLPRSHDRRVWDTDADRRSRYHR